jgi:hypothetical protein
MMEALGSSMPLLSNAPFVLPLDATKHTEALPVSRKVGGSNPDDVIGLFT